MALKTNLVSYWNLNEASGNRADSHGSNTLTDTNTVGSASDALMGTVARFVSANSESLRITDASQSGLDITGDITLNCWIKFASVASASHMLMSKWNHSNQNQYFMSINPSSKTMDCGTDDACSGFTYAIPNTTWSGTFNTTDWFMFTFVRTGTTGKLYINATQSGADQTVQTGVNCTAIFSIGTEAGREVGFVNGDMTRAGIWSRGLSGAEISELYNSGNGLTYAQLDVPQSTPRSPSGGVAYGNGLTMY